MLPIPTGAAQCAFLGALGMLAVAVLGGSPVATVPASFAFVALAAALAWTMPIGRRLRRDRLEFAWWVGSLNRGKSGGAVVPGAPFTVRCYMRYPGGHPVTLHGIAPVLPGGLRLLEPAPGLTLLPGTRTEVELRLMALAPGRHVLHGLALEVRGVAGLFSAPLYFPNPLVIQVLPRHAAPRRSAPRIHSGRHPMERNAPGPVHLHSGGTELRELRELQPGDPFKSIAWKASARTGKLMVREVDLEVQETGYVLVDVSGTMRDGSLGHRKLDAAIELSAAYVHQAMERGDRVGLVALDGRIVDHVPARDGHAQRLQLYEALVRLVDVVDADRTVETDDDVLALVGRYLRRQDGLDFASKRSSSGWDLARMAEHVRRSLSNRPAPRMQEDGSRATMLRAFCWLRGIPLTHKRSTDESSKAEALVEALRVAEGRGRAPRTIHIITDGNGIEVTPSLMMSLRRMRLQHQNVTCLLLDDATAADTSTYDGAALAGAASLAGALVVGQRLRGARRLREAKRQLGSYGIPTITVRPGDSPHRVLQRLPTRARRVA